MANRIFKSNNAYPTIPTITSDIKSHTTALQAIAEAIRIHERRTKDLDNSFVRVKELVDLGLITLVGGDFNVIGVDLGSIAGVADLTGASESDFLRFRSGEWVNDQLAAIDILQQFVTQHQAALSISASQIPNFAESVQQVVPRPQRGRRGRDSYIPGPTGDPGSTGPAGADGAAGVDGVGTPGRRGSRGRDSYIPGPTGDPGSTGPAGADGAAGVDGVGTPGRRGSRGRDSYIPGPTGDPGSTGPAGADGAAGVDGVGTPGRRGSRGRDSYIPGPTGDPGSTGPAGADGAAGVDGVGTPGRRGSRGRDSYIPGPPGDVSEITTTYFIQGARGKPGRNSSIPGPQGDAGSAGAGTAHTGTAILDFGVFPGATDVVFNVTGETAILAGSVVTVELNPSIGSSTDHSIEEHVVDGPICYAGQPVAGVGFPIYGVSRTQYRIWGSWNVSFVWV